jgi:hypothetical protein
LVFPVEGIREDVVLMFSIDELVVVEWEVEGLAMAENTRSMWSKAIPC